MPIVTLTTDFGTGSPYVAAMKAKLLAARPDAVLVDVVHSVPAFDVFTGAFLLWAGTRDFPPGCVHLAVVDPGRFFRTNVLGTQAMLEAARRVSVSRFHHISTCEVYGDLALDSDETFNEESPYRPRTPYNASKAGADHAVRAYVETYGLPATITNCCNNYGPYQFPEKIIPLFATNALDDRPLPLYASTANRREWLHVEDHCRAIEVVLERGRLGETYHVGSGREASIAEIADLVLQALGKPGSLKTIVPDRPGHDRRYLLDSSKLQAELGWEPKVAFESGLADTVTWYRNNRAWWEPLRGRAPVGEDTAWAQGPSR